MCHYMIKKVSRKLMYYDYFGLPGVNGIYKHDRAFDVYQSAESNNSKLNEGILDA